MFDKDKLEKAIKKSGFTVEKLADLLGINASTLYRKLKGTTEFSRTEIQIIREKLNLSIDEAENIFFASQLA